MATTTTTAAPFSATTDIVSLGSAGIAKLTPDQLASLTTDQAPSLTSALVAGLSSTQVAALKFFKGTDELISQDAIKGLTTKAIGGLSLDKLLPAQVTALTSAQIGALTSEQVSKVKAAAFSELTPEFINSLTPGAKGNLQGLKVAAFSASPDNLSATVIGNLTGAQLNSLKKATLGALSSEQISGIKDAQAAELKPAFLKDLGIDAVGGFTAKALAAITPAAFAGLTVDATGVTGNISGLTEEQLPTIKAPQIKALKADHIKTLGTAGDLAFINPKELAAGLVPGKNLGGLSLSALDAEGAQFSALTPAQIAGLSTTQVDAIDATTAPFLTAGAIAAMKGTQVEKLDATTVIPNMVNEAVAGFNAKNAANLDATQVAAFTVEQVPFLDPKAVAKWTGTGATKLAQFSAEEIVAFTPAALKAVASDAIPSLVSTAFASLTVEQLSMLDATKQVAKFTTDQISKLGTEQAEALTDKQVKVWTAAQATALDTATIAALKPATVAKLNITNFSSADVNALSGEQAGKLTAAQIKTLGSDSTPDNTTTWDGILGLKGEHFGDGGIKKLPADLLAAQVQALTTTAEGVLPALTSAHLNSLSATDIAKFSQVQAGALSADTKVWALETKGYALVTGTDTAFQGIDATPALIETVTSTAQKIEAGKAAISVVGGTGNDTIIGGIQTDTLSGGAGVDTLTGTGSFSNLDVEKAKVDIFDFSTNGSLATQTAPDSITDYAAGDTIKFGASVTQAAVDATTAVATSNVTVNTGGVIGFATADDTYAEKVTAIQADSGLDTAGKVALFIDGSDSYVYYSGAATGNTDDQIVKLAGVAATGFVLTDGNVTSVAFVPDTTAPTAPTIDVAVASDTGSSTTDNISSDTTPTVRVTFTAADVVAGATVQLLADASSVGTATLVAADITAGYVDITASALGADATFSLTSTVTDSAGNVSAASTAISYVLDTTAPVAPTTLNLATADDTGTNSDDNTSSTTALTIDGVAVTGDTVTLYDTDGTTVLGTATAASNAFSTDIALAAGTHSITAKSTDTAGNTGDASTALSVVVDTTAPTSTISSAGYAAGSDTITLTGTNFDTLLGTGETTTTDVKARLDWTKFVWDINGDGSSTADVTFAVTDITSAKATSATALTIVLAAAKGTALEATTGYNIAGPTAADTLDVGAGFIIDLVGNVSTTDAIVNGAITIS